MNNSIISTRRPLGEVNREPTPLITNEILQGIVRDIEFFKKKMT